MVFQTFGKSIVQRLARVLPNIWQKYYPTFDKGVIQRLIKVLSRSEKTLINYSKPIYTSIA